MLLSKMFGDFLLLLMSFTHLWSLMHRFRNTLYILCVLYQRDHRVLSFNIHHQRFSLKIPTNDFEQNLKNPTLLHVVWWVFIDGSLKSRWVDRPSCVASCRGNCENFGVLSACSLRFWCKSNFWSDLDTSDSGPVCRSSTHRCMYAWKQNVVRK